MSLGVSPSSRVEGSKNDEEIGGTVKRRKQTTRLLSLPCMHWQLDSLAHRSIDRVGERGSEKQGLLSVISERLALNQT